MKKLLLNLTDGDSFVGTLFLVALTCAAAYSWFDLLFGD